MPQVLVIGSINLDNVFKCKDFPKPGETILCNEYFYGPGGKGLNQAVAAARNGVTTQMAGAIGNDPNGKYLLDFMMQEKINTDNIIISKTLPTGVAHITIDSQSENSIIVASGANMIDNIPIPNDIKNADVILSQLEIKVEVIAEYFKKGKFNILNCAPVNQEANAIFPLCDILIMNEHELQSFANLPNVPEEPSAIVNAAKGLLCKEAQTIIVTLGSQGVMVISHKDESLIPAHKVTATDTTGAGDCFCGVFAAQIATNSNIDAYDIKNAAYFANIAASIQVTRKGAAAAMPSHAETLKLQHIKNDKI